MSKFISQAIESLSRKSLKVKVVVLLFIIMCAIKLKCRNIRILTINTFDNESRMNLLVIRRSTKFSLYQTRE